jgi:hypothetical protein
MPSFNSVMLVRVMFDSEARSVQAGPTSLAGPSGTALHGGELQPKLQPAMSGVPSGRAMLARMAMQRVGATH